MRRSSTSLLLALLSLLVLGGTAVSCSAGTEELTALPVTDLRSGEQTTLGAQASGPTVVNVWASWCAPCLTEMPAFEAVHQRTDGVTFVGVTDDPDRDATLDVAEQTGVTYDLLQSNDPSLFATLGISGLPATVFLDADGQVVESHTGQLTEDALSEKIRSLYGIT